jgi:pyruvate formate lyase activating enzyme
MALSGTKMDTAEVMAEIVQDKAYYDGSGGGLTISGGEVFCQLPFALELAGVCKNEGISAAVETNLSFPYGEMAPLLKSLDLVICDLKIMDAEAHEKHTGMGNRMILENIYTLSREGILFVVRTPLVPGVTDTDENIASIADFLRDLPGLRYYELLNFNPLGASKYKSLGRENPFGQARPLPAGRIKELSTLAGARGITVRAE